MGDMGDWTVDQGRASDLEESWLAEDQEAWEKRSILFLDDCPTRCHWAQKHLKPYGRFTASRTAANCILWIGQRAHDEVYLDHDLDGEAWANPHGKNTGFEVVRWIVLNKPEIGKIIVHSMNTPQGNRMAKALRRHGYDAEYRSWMTIVGEAD